MSYDVYLKAQICDKCGGNAGPEPYSLPDPTYNLTPIFDLALTGEPLPNADTSEMQVVLFRAPTERPRGLRVLSGRKASDTTDQIRLALEAMRDPEKREQFLALQPENGWGDLPGAIEVMEKYHAAALEYPNNVWDIR